MYKYLTPQEIEEFEELYVSWVVYEPKFSGEMLGEAGLKLKKDALSLIDTLMGKRVGEIRKLPTFGNAEPLHARNKEYYNGYVAGYKSASEIALSLLSPDSPKRNEE